MKKWLYYTEFERKQSGSLGIAAGARI